MIKNDYINSLSSTEEIIEDARNGKMFILIENLKCRFLMI